MEAAAGNHCMGFWRLLPLLRARKWLSFGYVNPLCESKLCFQSHAQNLRELTVGAVYIRLKNGNMI